MEGSVRVTKMIGPLIEAMEKELESKKLNQGRPMETESELRIGRLKAEIKVYQEADNLEINSFKVENERLREALEKHGVHTSIDCTYGPVISSPDRPQKPCVCGLEEALKNSP